MSNRQSSPLVQDYLAAAQWWQLAGVDCGFEDDATDWLAEPEPLAEPEAPQTAAKPPEARAPAMPDVPQIVIGGDSATWPADLAPFQQWWLTADNLDTGGSRPRVAPRGGAGAELMIIVPEPEPEDSDSLLSGPQGRLLTGFLAAAGVAPESTYFAAALPRHTPLPEWDRLAAAGLGKLLTHHVGLVAPKRILAFGRNILPLLGHDTAQAAAVLHEFNHDGRTIPVMGAATLGELLRSTGRRKQFWHRWLDWTEG